MPTPSLAPLVAEARRLLQGAPRVAALTGAGISAESGVPTFRGPDGLWQGFSAQELASPEGFARHPDKVWEWYNWRRATLAAVRPNPAHHALASLERRAAFFGLATQNVDRLHQAAGSTRIVELHGNIWEVRCTACATVTDASGVTLAADPRCTACGGRLRPAVVWFGEALPHGAFERAAAWAAACEVFLVVGTSAVVQPAASLATYARRAGAVVVEINLEPTPLTALADLALHGKAGELLPLLVNSAPAAE